MEENLKMARIKTLSFEEKKLFHEFLQDLCVNHYSCETKYKERLMKLYYYYVFYIGACFDCEMGMHTYAVPSRFKMDLENFTDYLEFVINKIGNWSYIRKELADPTDPSCTDVLIEGVLLKKSVMLIKNNALDRFVEDFENFKEIGYHTEHEALFLDTNQLTKYSSRLN